MDLLQWLQNWYKGNCDENKLVTILQIFRDFAER